jgi:DNA-binding FadR family transcriptional regulator
VAKTSTPSAGLTAIHRVGPTQQVREQLLAAIERGDYRPGEFLPSERVLCDTFGVSRVSVREAIAGLEAMNLITVQHGRGALVREDAGTAIADSFGRYLGEHRDELLELLRVRQALDGLAAEDAARAATKRNVANLRKLNDQFVSTATGPDVDLVELARRDVAFHMAIASASGGTLLPRMLGELNEVLSDSRRATLSRRGQLSASAKQHQAIIDAVALGDEKGAQQAARRHMTGIITWVSTFGNEAPQD